MQWFGVSSSHYHSHCGDSFGHELTEALDGNDYWSHLSNESHWFIIDLGASYNVMKIRGRSNTAFDPVDIDVYISDSLTSWGTAVTSNITTWQDTDTWVEVNTTDKTGRYVKVEIIETEAGASSPVRFGNSSSPYPIFDVYVVERVTDSKVKVDYRTASFDVSTTGWSDDTNDVHDLTLDYTEFDVFLNRSSKNIQFQFSDWSGSNFKVKSYELFGELLSDR